ncbi:polysaccharide biosynthesis protein, partial [Flavihumibacter sediminis]|nr:polysaccharide biosynthesis protein [Flavihumibacter sediminis]
PYAKKKLISYLVLVSLIVGLHRLILMAYSPLWFSLLTGLLLLAGFVYFVSKVEEREWKKVRRQT